MSKLLYNSKFYEERTDSLIAAKHIVPYLLKLTKVESVVDIGCGNGVFLSIFNKEGVKEYLGIDGDWVDKKYLKIPSENFLTADFEKPFDLNKKYDLAISLEVAEHISSESAENFIKSIIQLAPIVIFSAAIPLQGGTHHVNEQWPKYWAKLFANYDYVAIDCLRRKFWENKDIPYWYSQNMILYIHKDRIKKESKLEELYKLSGKEILALVHPTHYVRKAKVWKFVWDLIPGSLKTIVKRIYK